MLMKSIIFVLLSCWSRLFFLLFPPSCVTYALNTFSAASTISSFFNQLIPTTQQQRREELKSELLQLISKSSPPGKGEFSNKGDRERFEELFYEELPSLNPTYPNSAQCIDIFSGEWECRWTDEKELNFLVRNGLFGERWKRTYQVIDVRNQQLENTLLFGDEDNNSALCVKSTLIPDEVKGSRFNIKFYEASVKWRRIEIPIPPLGKGWGELLYLDNDMRLQRDIRGDCIVATKVNSI